MEEEYKLVYWTWEQFQHLAETGKGTWTVLGFKEVTVVSDDPEEVFIETGEDIGAGGEGATCLQIRDEDNFQVRAYTYSDRTEFEPTDIRGLKGCLTYKPNK